MAVPGKPLLFMGGELGQATEWAGRQVDWAALEDNVFSGGCSSGWQI